MNAPDVDALMRNYRAYLRLERGFADNTLMAYEADVERLLSTLRADNMHPCEVTTDYLQSFLADLVSFDISPRSVARVISSLKNFFRYLFLEKYIDSDPTQLLDSPQFPAHLPTVLTVGQIDAMIDAIDVSSPHGARNRAIIETLYSCGLRVSELVNLELSRVNLDKLYIIVTGKGSKERMVPLAESTAAIISGYVCEVRPQVTPKPGDEDIVFLNRRGGRLTRNMVFMVIRDLARAIGITTRVGPHTLRHSFATHLLQGGANLRAIQQMLGHASIGTTEIYLHLQTAELHTQILAHHPRNIRS